MVSCMKRTAPTLGAPPVIARVALTILAILAMAVIIAMLTVAVPALSGASPVTTQGDQLCVRTTCLDRTLRVTTYQTQPDLPSPPPSSLYTGR